MTLRWRPPSFTELFRRTKGTADLTPSEVSLFKELDLAIKTIFDTLYTVQASLTDDTTAKLASLNGLTAPAQLFATGTSGSSFNIVSAIATHTFNLPNAGAGATGSVTTTAQTFGGMKKFSAGLKVNDAVTFTDLDTSPTVAAGNLFKASNSAPTSITTFNDGGEGQLLIILFTTINTTIVAGAGMKLAGGANFVGTADDTLTLMLVGTTWYEVTRSVNA